MESRYTSMNFHGYHASLLPLQSRACSQVSRRPPSTPLKPVVLRRLYGVADIWWWMYVHSVVRGRTRFCLPYIRRPALSIHVGDFTETAATAPFSVVQPPGYLPSLCHVGCPFGRKYC